MQSNLISYCELRFFKSNSTTNPKLPFPHYSQKNQITSNQLKFEGNVQLNSQLLKSALNHTRGRSKQILALREDEQKEMSQHNKSQQLNVIKTMKNSKVKPNKHHQSLSSELYEIQSQKTNKLQKQAQILLNNNILGQSMAVYEHVFGHQLKVPSNLLNTWKQCLFYEDRQQICGNSVEVPYTHARIFPVNDLQKNMGNIYGNSKQRCLRPGQQSIIIASIQKYLEKCFQKPHKFARKPYDIIVNDILSDTNLPQLQDYPYCMKQIEAHFMVMATKWRYSGKLNLKDKTVESCLATGRNSIIDLRKNTPLTKFLLLKCKVNSQITQ